MVKPTMPLGLSQSARRFLIAIVCAAAWLNALSPLSAQILVQRVLVAPPEEAHVPTHVPTFVQVFIMRGQSAREYRASILYNGQWSLLRVKRVLASTQEPLTAEQEAKLQVAMEGVLSQALHDISEYRVLTDHLNMSDHKDTQKAMALMQPVLLNSGDEFFSCTSRFWQYVASILTPSQLSVLTKLEDAARLRRHHAVVLKTLDSFDAQLCLSMEQRQQLVKLMDEVEVPGIPETHVHLVGIAKLMRLFNTHELEFLEAEQREQVKLLTDPFEDVEAGIR